MKMKEVLVVVLITLCLLTYTSCAPFQKGMSFGTYGSSVPYDSPQAVESLQRMKQSGVDSVAIVFSWYQANISSTVIGPTSSSPTDDALQYIVENAIKLGFKVTVKPMVDCLDGTWRAWIGSQFTTANEWDVWFQSYSNYMNHYAALSNKWQVEQYVSGTEMITASAQTQHFRNVIAQIREYFKGTVTYAANWGTVNQVTYNPKAPGMANGGEINNIQFINDLDIIGVDAYYYLVNEENPTLNQLNAAWAPIVTMLANISKTWSKPIIFTEIGYRSIEGAAIHPGWWNTTESVNLTQQAICYTSVFNSFQPQSWWNGIYWWLWTTDPNYGGASNTDFTPQNKPAQDVLLQYYK